MPLQLSIADPSDLDALTACQFAAFYPHEALHDVIWPGPPTPDNLAKCKARQQAWMQADGHSTYLKITDTNTGTIVAGAKWCIYEEDSERPERIMVDWYGEEGSAERAFGQELIDEFHRRRVERMKGPHCLLDLCFCSPTHQHRGAGTQLVQWGTRKADEMGVQAFVEGTLTGRRLYEENGFVVTEDIKLKEDTWAEKGRIEYLFMHRPARATVTQIVAT
ncbi:hypothetical protein MMC32_001382 [Xylographa parallela]|nr:hypothetical protein [Xylographa parallela]